MVITNLQIEHKAKKSKFFQKIFLVAITKFKVILGIFLSKISNVNMLFGKKTLI